MKHIKAVGVAGAVFLSLFIYLLISPFINHGIGVLAPPHFSSMSDAVMHYQVVGSTATVFSGAVGLVLGYFYYISRQKHDVEQFHLAKFEQNMRFIVEDMTRYDAAVGCVLTQNFSTDTELQFLRHQIGSFYDNIYLLLSAEGIIGNDLDPFIDLHSFVDNDEVIMDWDLKQINDQPIGVSATCIVYADRVHAARESCYRLTSVGRSV